MTIDFKGMRKAELHAHFNGCVPPDVIVGLVEQHCVELPEGFSLPRDLMVLSPVGSLLEYFRPWNVFKRLPLGKECLDTMANAAVRALVDDGIAYAELRNSPYNIAELNGISMEEGLEWLIDALEQASSRHGIDARLIISFSRFKFDLDRAKALLDAIGEVNHKKRIVGLDLSGNESDPIDNEVASLFRRAKDDLGLGVTIHAGEFGGIENVRWAIEACHADRVGHGLAMASDDDVLKLVVDRGTCIEVCLTSNLMTGRYSQLQDHAVTRFIECGVEFILCSDNPAVHQKTLSDEYAAFIELTQRRDILQGMFERQMRHAFSEAL